MPYLHEKKIYLNRLKPITEYFYTTIEPQGYHVEKNQKYVVAVNLTEYKFYIFSERGLLRNRYDFEEKVMEYGVPTAVS